MSNETVKAIEANIEKSRKFLDMEHSLSRLRENKDFKKVIIEGYFQQEAIRLVQLKADPNMQTPQMQAAILKDIDSIGSLGKYFDTVVAMGQRAKVAIDDGEEALAEIAAEELNNV